MAFFPPGGWLSEYAYGRRGGWTYVESFKHALRVKPRFIEIHQFNEFAGQPEGHGYGPNKDVYVDSYSVELSDDIEPVSLTAPAYRGEGAWGFFYLNLTRALAQEWGAHGVTVNCIAPAWLDDSPGLGDPDPQANRLIRFIPMRRPGNADEVAPLALYLASEASGYVTGQILFVDGGLTCHL